MEKQFGSLTGKVGDYNLGRTLGQGATAKVKIGEKDGEYFAVKILKDVREGDMKALQRELESLEALDHPNILKVHNYDFKGTLVKPGCQPKQVIYIVSELIPNGELLDYLNVGQFSDELIRYFIRQILSALLYMQNQGYSHRDLKPDNISVDKDFNLKIIDFGFARDNAGDTGAGLVKTKVGTATYMAPEISAGVLYKAIDADLFATAVMIFVMTARTYPWDATTQGDAQYRYFVNHQMEDWWAQKSAQRGGPFDPNFVDLLDCMFANEISTRLSLADFIAHPWTQGPILTHEEVFETMDNMKQQARQIHKIQLHAQREEEKAAPRRPRRALGTNEQWKEMPIDLNVKHIGDVNFLPLTSFPSDKDAAVILETIAKDTSEDGAELVFSKNSFKMTYKKEIQQEVMDDEVVPIIQTIQVRVLAVDGEADLYVEFAKIEGPSLYFQDEFTKFMGKLAVRTASE